jgi:hypothetical protein
VELTDAFVNRARDLRGVALGDRPVPYGTYLRWGWPLLAALAALAVVVLGAGALAA